MRWIYRIYTDSVESDFRVAAPGEKSDDRIDD